MIHDDLPKRCLRDDCQLRHDCINYRNPAAPLPIYPMHYGNDCPFFVLKHENKTAD